MRAKKILVIGATGFIGRHVFSHLASSPNVEPVNAREVGVDLLDIASVSRAIDAQKPDAIVNLAAVSTLVQTNIPLIYRLNGQAIIEVLNLLERIGFQGRFVNTSSCLVYGMNTPNAIAEDHPALPVHHYAIAKLMADQALMQFRKNIDCVAVRPFNCIGRDHGPNFIVPKIVRHFKAALSTIELGHTNNKRDFVDVRDMARMFSTVVLAKAAPTIINFCSGTATSIDDIIQIMREMTGRDMQVSHNPEFMRSADNPYMCGDNSALKSLGYSNNYQLTETLRWMLEQ